MSLRRPGLASRDGCQMDEIMATCVDEPGSEGGRGFVVAGWLAACLLPWSALRPPHCFLAVRFLRSHAGEGREECGARRAWAVGMKGGRRQNEAVPVPSRTTPYLGTES